MQMSFKNWNQIYLKHLNLFDDLQKYSDIFVKVRSTGKLLSAEVTRENQETIVNLKLKETGVSPGQACVFYREDQFGHKVLGGGWIKE